MNIIRAIVESYDGEHHQADVRPCDHPAALWPALPVAADVSGELLPAGATVAVLMWSDISGVVLGPYGVSYDPFVSGVARGGSAAYSGASWQPIHSTLTLVTRQPAYAWLQAFVRWSTSTVRTQALSLYVMDESGTIGEPLPEGNALAGQYHTSQIAFRTTDAMSPGSHDFVTSIYVLGGATINVQSCRLSVLMLPTA